MTLEQIREELNKIDAELVRLVARRQSFMPLVGKYKKENKLPINQPLREKEILEHKKKMADELHVDNRLIEKIFKLLFVNGKSIQRKS